MCTRPHHVSRQREQANEPNTHPTQVRAIKCSSAWPEPVPRSQIKNTFSFHELDMHGMENENKNESNFRLFNISNEINYRRRRAHICLIRAAPVQSLFCVYFWDTHFPYQ